MRGDGDGWATCGAGHRHWGVVGAAGLLLRALDPAGVPHVLLQHRAEWTQEGGTWGLPGGARDSHEDAVTAALREADEEAGVTHTSVRVRDEFRDDHGAWSYTTVVADTDALLPTRAQRESLELSWVPETDVATLPLHSGFAATWPQLRAVPVVLLVDVADVVGAVPQGRWGEPAVAGEWLLQELERLPGRTVPRSPGSSVPYGVLREVVAVLPAAGGAAVVEAAASGGTAVDGTACGDAALGGTAPDGTVPDGAARGVAAPEGLAPGGAPPLHVVRAGSPDKALAEVWPERADAGQPVEVVVVSADRAARDRLTDSAAVVGPGWLLALLSQ